MRVTLDARYYATLVYFLLASDSVVACQIASSESARVPFPRVKTIVIPDASLLHECVASLSASEEIQLGHPEGTVHDGKESVFAYSRNYRRTDYVGDQGVRAMRAAECLANIDAIRHLDISVMDVGPEALAQSRTFHQVWSLDLARLDLEDEFIVKLFKSGIFRNLRWLDLSGNARISLSAIEAISAAVFAGRLPRLVWIDLLGTDCDASPYIDGRHWRMSQVAIGLARSYGSQPWMMLGSRVPELANKELLTEHQRQIPPDRLSLL